MRTSGYGITVDVPTGWTSAVVRRSAGGSTAADGTGRGALAPVAPGDAGRATPGDAERTMPVVHVSTRPIPQGVGDFGSGLVEAMAPDDAFVALIEYGTDLADAGLFERQGLPRLAPSQFSPGRMQRALPERSASQHFFSLGGRAFCLYTVIGSHSRRMATVPRAAGVVRSLVVDSAGTMRRRGVLL